MMEIGWVIDIRGGLAERAGLKPGDLLNVKVLEVLENQRARVELCRLRTLAELSFPVAAGDELRVRVQEIKGQLRLQLITDSSGHGPPAGSAGPVMTAAVETLNAVHARVGRAVGAAQRLPDARQLPLEIRAVADALRLFLEPIDPRWSVEALARKLREFCEDSGLFLECRLAAAARRTSGGAAEAPAPGRGSNETADRILSTDLKSRLLLLKGYFDSAAGRQLTRDSREASGLAAAAAELLADIRAGQEQMAKAGAHPPPFQTVHFGLPMPGGRGRASLKIAYGRRSAAGKNKGHRAAILLELDPMGPVRADLTLLGTRLNVTVFVSNTGLRDRVSRHASEVRGALSPLFEHVAFQVAVSARKIARFETEEWRSAGATQVDVRI